MHFIRIKEPRIRKACGARREMSAMRILLIEDAPLIAKPLAHALKRAGYAVDCAYDGISGLARARTQCHDVLIIDIMLPGIDGLSIVRKLRTQGIEIPIILLTARGDVRDRVIGLDLGADDYLAKPFHTEELLARIRAVLRRHGSTSPAETIRFDALSYEPAPRILTCDEKSVSLTPKEGLLLEVLMRNPAAPIPKERLLAAGWGSNITDGCGNASCVEVYISLLRRKLREVGSSARIEVRREAGYRLRAH